MSGLREYLDALGRILSRNDRRPERDDPLRRPREPLLSWELARFIPAQPDGRGQAVTIAGLAYGRPFQIPFPVGPPPEHRWGAYVWEGTFSGTGRTEVRAACWSCSHRLDRWVTPEQCATDQPAAGPDYVWSPKD